VEGGPVLGDPPPRGQEPGSARGSGRVTFWRATEVRATSAWAWSAADSRAGLRADAFERLAVAQAAGVAAVGSWYHTALAASKAPVMSSEETGPFSVP